MEATTTRTPQEVFEHHGEVLVAGDLDGIVSDYADDAIFITPAGILRGKDGVRKGFEKLLGDLPSAEWELAHDATSRTTSCCWSGRRDFREDQGRGRDRHVRVPRRPDPRADGALHAHAGRLTRSSGSMAFPPARRTPK